MDPLELAKQLLMQRGSAKHSEVQAQEGAFHQMIAQRRRLAALGPMPDSAAVSEADAYRNMDASRAAAERAQVEYGRRAQAKNAGNLRTMPAAPANFAGLTPAEIIGTVGQAVDDETEQRNEAEMARVMRRANAADVDYYNSIAANHGLPPGSVLPSDATGQPEHMPDGGRSVVARPDIMTPYGTKSPTLGTPNAAADGYAGNDVLGHPAVERYAALDDLRASEVNRLGEQGGSQKFYGDLAREAPSHADFARLLAGQLTAKRILDMGYTAPDHADPLAAQLYRADKMPVY